MEYGSIAVREQALRHVLRKQLGRGPHEHDLWQRTKQALVDIAAFDLVIRHVGSYSIMDGNGFRASYFLPDYDDERGLFHECMRRLLVPGRGIPMMFFDMTGVCPCFCDYCFSLAGGANPPDIPDAKAYDIAEKIVELGVPLVFISGGEPLARYDRLVRVIKILNQRSEVRLNTTGIGLTRQRARELRDSGLKTVVVSLDPVGRDEHDQQRRLPGAYDTAIEALRIFASEGILTLAGAVVNKRTSGAQIEDYFKLVERINPHIVSLFQPQLYTGRGKKLDDSFTEFDERYFGLANEIVGIAGKYHRPVQLLFGKADEVFGCIGAGGGLLHMDIWGNLNACVSKGSVGNIFETSFESMYRDYLAMCTQFKVGMFCSLAAQYKENYPLTRDETQQLLRDFYGAYPDSILERHRKRLGSVVKWAARVCQASTKKRTGPNAIPEAHVCLPSFVPSADAPERRLSGPYKLGKSCGGACGAAAARPGYSARPLT